MSLENPYQTKKIMPNRKLKGKLLREIPSEMRGKLLAVCFEGLKWGNCFKTLIYLSFVATSYLSLKMGPGKKKNLKKTPDRA